MKKILLLVAVLAVSTMAMAQKLDDVIAKYKAEPKAECMTMTKDMLSMLTTMAAASKDMSDEDRKSMEMLKNIDQMTTLMIEKADPAVAAALMDDARAALSKDYEITTDMQDNEDKVLVAMKKKKKKDTHASEVVVVANTDGEAVLLYITGKIDLDNISSLMKMTK